MKIVKARLYGVPVLAWVAARAFAAESSRKGVCLRAIAGYPLHFLSVLLVSAQGQLWQGEYKALIGIAGPGWRSQGRAVAGAVGLCVVGFLAFWCWLPSASMAGLKALLFVMALVLVFLVLALVSAVKEFHPARARANSAAIRRWKRARPGCAFYKVSYLAMYPQTGEGFTFARKAIEQVVPARVGIYTEARTSRHRVIYARAGLRPCRPTPVPACARSRTRLARPPWPWAP